MHKRNVQKKAYSDYKDRAHKNAVFWYPAEKAKAKWMSAQQVREAMLVDWHWCPSAQTIQRYANKYTIADHTRLEMGPKGGPPPAYFYTLANTFITMVRINQFNGREGENSRKSY